MAMIMVVAVVSAVVAVVSAVVAAVVVGWTRFSRPRLPPSPLAP